MQYTREWSKDYVKLMLGGDMEEAFNLKLNNFPRLFFKYRTLDEYTLDSLKSKSVWLSEIQSLNDPFECSLQFDQNESFRFFFKSDIFKKNFKERFGVEISRKDQVEIAQNSEPYLAYARFCEKKGINLTSNPKQQFEFIDDRTREILTEANRNIRISCFSERNDSILMWSHYANQHLGICIAYDLLDEAQIRAFLQPAVYSKDIFKLNTLDELNSVSHIMASLIKCEDWEYESEWRLTITSKAIIEKKFIATPIPKAIYLGVRFDLNLPPLREQLMTLADEQKIPVFKMKLHPSEYRLTSL